MFIDLQATKVHTLISGRFPPRAGPCSTRRGRWGATRSAAAGSAAGPRLGRRHRPRFSQFRLKDQGSVSYPSNKRTCIVLLGLHFPFVAETLAPKLGCAVTMDYTPNSDDSARHAFWMLGETKRDEFSCVCYSFHGLTSTFKGHGSHFRGTRGPPSPSFGDGEASARRRGSSRGQGCKGPSLGAAEESWGQRVCDVGGGPAGVWGGFVLRDQLT